MKDKYWTKVFMNEFYLNSLQYFYLNKFQRLRVEGSAADRVAYFSDDVVVSLKDSTVTQSGKVLRKKDVIFFPASWINNQSYVVYSPFTASVDLDVPDEFKGRRKVTVQEVTETGLIRKRDLRISGNKIQLTLEGNRPLLLSFRGS